MNNRRHLLITSKWLDRGLFLLSPVLRCFLAVIFLFCCICCFVFPTPLWNLPLFCFLDLFSLVGLSNVHKTGQECSPGQNQTQNILKSYWTASGPPSQQTDSASLPQGQIQEIVPAQCNNTIPHLHLTETRGSSYALFTSFKLHTFMLHISLQTSQYCASLLHIFILRIILL